MTNEELKEALIWQWPVEYDGIKYKCITGIIYRRDLHKKERIGLQVELMSRKRHSVTIANPERVSLIKKDLED